jgi:hypothetical protein
MRVGRVVPSSENEIVSFVHCRLCLEELQKMPMTVKKSPREYASLEVGFTKLGVQVWCKRHGVNVMHVDFEGQKHPANTARSRE